LKEEAVEKDLFFRGVSIQANWTAVNFTYDCSLKGKTVETSFQTFLDLNQLGQVLLQVDARVLEITGDIIDE
jgi:hypothetical protein